MIEADHLIILTSVEGLYDRDPSEPGAQFIEEIEDVSAHLESTKSISELGSGGMLTKMLAANMAQNAGVETIIAEGIIESPVSSVLRRERRHTRCLATGKTASPLMIWLSNRLQVSGTLAVKKAAVQAITNKERGLSRDDLVSIQGEFVKGDVLHVYDEEGNEFARGMTNFSSEETILMARHLEMKVEDVIGYKTKSDIIGSENLLILEDHHLQLDAPEDDHKPVIALS